MTYSRKRNEGRFAPGRVLVAVALFAGASAIGLSLLQGMDRGQASTLRQSGTLVAETGDFAATAELADNPGQDTHPAPKRTQADAPATTKPASTGQPAREPAPPEAVAVSSVRAVGAAGGTTKPSSNQPSDGDPYSITLVIADGKPLKPMAQEVARRLSDDGYNAKVSSLDNAGRPDALLLLGMNPEKSAAGWYCDPGLPAGAALSRTVVDALSTLPEDPGGLSNTAVSGPTSTFPCEDISVGRARAVASLVELPVGLVKRPEAMSIAVDGISTGIEHYFDLNGASVRSTRSNTRVAWPATGRISSYFGPSHPLGIDIAQYEGNITAATDGIVAFAGGNECCSYGLYVVLDSPSGIRTVYGHLSKIAVNKGQKVKQGQALGVVGCTGHCTGNHLHFEVIERGARQDPLRYLP